ncbi:MAG: hypothetical protein U9Q66_02205, partial [Patescibacteria group bacterium]|nr:hypothetical protein [Patescibacteria group bacterium]
KLIEINYLEKINFDYFSSFSLEQKDAYLKSLLDDKDCYKLLRYDEFATLANFDKLHKNITVKVILVNEKFQTDKMIIKYIKYLSIDDLIFIFNQSQTIYTKYLLDFIVDSYEDTDLIQILSTKAFENEESFFILSQYKESHKFYMDSEKYSDFIRNRKTEIQTKISECEYYKNMENSQKMEIIFELKSFYILRQIIGGGKL